MNNLPPVEPARRTQHLRRGSRRRTRQSWRQYLRIYVCRFGRR
jgi:hypothetical protein